MAKENNENITNENLNSNVQPNPNLNENANLQANSNLNGSSNMQAGANLNDGANVQASSNLNNNANVHANPNGVQNAQNYSNEVAQANQNINGNMNAQANQANPAPQAGQANQANQINQAGQSNQVNPANQASQTPQANQVNQTSQAGQYGAANPGFNNYSQNPNYSQYQAQNQNGNLNNYNANGNANNAPKKSNTATIVVISIIAVLVIALIGFAIYYFGFRPKTVKAPDIANLDQRYAELQNQITGTVQNMTNGSSSTTPTTGGTSNSGTNTTQPTTGSSTLIGANWESGEFSLDGVTYKLGDPLSKFLQNGWTIEWKDSSNLTETYTLNPKDKVTSSLYLKNSKYPFKYSSPLSVKLANPTNSPVNIKEAAIYSISLFENYSSTDGVKDVPFEIPGGIKSGASFDTVKAAIESTGAKVDTYNSSSSGTSSVSASSSDYNKSIRVSIDAKKGASEFSLYNYGLTN